MYLEFTKLLDISAKWWSLFHAWTLLSYCGRCEGRLDLNELPRLLRSRLFLARLHQQWRRTSFKESSISYKKLQFSQEKLIPDFIFQSFLTRPQWIQSIRHLISLHNFLKTWRKLFWKILMSCGLGVCLWVMSTFMVHLFRIFWNFVIFSINV